ncbi:spore germination protein KA [Gottschalkia purinilytica]|uniref:Spore germination protein KA n=1 Tax=Gottschalkia purinilytica TaxID=1503 RepID=A0A0L0WE75_GOTPU|nr:spore germination protein [Gottschalkia purinilytica]KNF09782.1 spore germination protein KA [Gottschalkia purinilytica]
MSLLRRLIFGRKGKKNNNDDNNNYDDNRIPISKNIDKNLDILKEEFKDCDDIVYKEFLVGTDQSSRLAIAYVDGLIDKALITQNITKALMQEARGREPENIKKGLYKLIKEGNLSASEMEEVDFLTECIDAMLSGDTVLLIDGYKKAIIVGSRGWHMRGIDEPESEALVRGPRDGFNETLKISISSVRRRIKDTKLKVKYMKVGRRSKTDIALLYIEDIIDKEVLEEVRSRIEKIDIDAVLDSAYIEEFIEDSNYSLFPQLESTERPDAVAAAIYEGRVGILVDNTPFALIAPAVFTTFFESSEDYYERWPLAALMRIIRYAAAFISILTPALYIAITSFHPGILPSDLALYIAATRLNVPFPSFIEAFMMQFTIEFLRESGTRISGPIGTTIGVVGGLVIGQAAVEAGIVSPLMVIIVAITTIASFALPNYTFSIATRILTFAFMVLAASFGFYGIMIGLIVMGTHLCNLSSFGIPYTSPISVLGKFNDDLKDTFIRVPLPRMRYRPHYGKLKDEDLQPPSDE